ncbi:hypothetical protein SAMN06297251_10133 [Fulvimarina manganoxydans]|uniref:Uncharacterized protein n=1 Tax=Fulvimarina manganoxydans TaxID=937218 RepID=A0A1W1Y8H5_9HYPH|nr:hypothetical protein [Fulvimarina manganoxydans]SMC32453.1 hypothetical protein SAMN06297251_10133 [Fulvimarina manganoxydans]
MSASTSKRLGRLVARIAEERAVRGRTKSIARPRTVKALVAGLEDAPQTQGSAAEMNRYDISPPLPAATRQHLRRITDAEGAWIGSAVDTTGLIVRLERGVDYAGIATEGSGGLLAGTVETKLEPEEKSMLDRVFEVEGFEASDEF